MPRGRVEISGELYRAADDIKKDSELISKIGGDGTKRGQIAEMTRDHLDRMFNPGNDWPIMRAVMFATVGWSAMQRFPCGCRNGRL